jgi:hypothetical protein
VVEVGMFKEIEDAMLALVLVVATWVIVVKLLN